MIHTEYKEQNLDIRRAFLFSIFTGVRFCDVKDLKYSNVDFSNEWILFEQNKTKGHSNTSSVTINITPNILQLIGKPKRDGENHIIDENIFKLPSYEACNKSLKRWSKKAGITKNITWHCARHTFATILVRQNVNPVDISSMLGHSGLKYITRYTRSVNENKKIAIENVSNKFQL